MKLEQKLCIATVRVRDGDCIDDFLRYLLIVLAQENCDAILRCVAELNNECNFLWR